VKTWPLVGSKWDPKKPITRRAMHKRIVAAGLDAVFDENSPGKELSANLTPSLVSSRRSEPLDSPGS